MLRLAAGVPLWTVGCATSALPLPGPVPNAPPIALGLTGSYHAALDPATLAHLNALGPIVLRAAVQSAAQARAILDSLTPFPNLRVLLLVETADLALVGQLVPAGTTSPTVLGIELGNELDLADLTPSAFSSFVRDGYDTLRAAGFTGLIVSGGIYSVQPESLAWLRAAMVGWPDDVVLGVHRYGDPDRGQNGYDSRLEETAALRQLAGAHPIAVTEFGYPTRTLSDEAWIAAAVRRDVAWFRSLGAVLACLYQLEDGPTSADINRYGLRTGEGRWRPVEGVFADVQK